MEVDEAPVLGGARSPSACRRAEACAEGDRYDSPVRALRYLVAVAAWVGAACASLWVAAETEFGPTIAVLSSRHGIHRGDLVVLIAGIATASMVTLAALRPSRA